MLSRQLKTVLASTTITISLHYRYGIKALSYICVMERVAPRTQAMGHNSERARTRWEAEVNLGGDLLGCRFIGA